VQIGNKEVLINPNVVKFACIMAIMSGFFWWPSESAYKRYENKKKEIS